MSNTNDYIITTLSSGSTEYTNPSDVAIQAPFILGVPTSVNLRLKGQPYYVSLGDVSFTREAGSTPTPPVSDTVFYTEIISASNVNNSASMHIGSLYLDAQTYTTFGAMFADIGSGGNNSHVELKRFTGGATLLTLTNTTSSFAYVTASSVTVSTADWYDIYISASGNPATASIRGIYYEI